MARNGLMGRWLLTGALLGWPLLAPQVAAGASPGAAAKQRAAGRLDPEQVPRVSPQEARRKVQGGQALLVCAYEDEERCRGLALEGSLTLGELAGKLDGLGKDQEIVFYCA